MRKIRILGIAPYEGLKNMMDALAEYRSDITMTTYLADLDNAVTLVSGLDLDSYDAVLSRGGTYLALKKVVTLPIFDIELSYYDIINAIKLADGMNMKMGIVAYPNIATLTRQICEILNYDIDIFVTDSWEDTTQHIDYMKDRGYQLIVGDMSACRYSRECGISSILFTSGSETIRKSIDQIVAFSNYYLDYQIENRIIKSGMISRDEILLIFQQDKTLYSANTKNPDPLLVRDAKRIIPELDKHGSFQSVRIHKNTPYTFHGDRSIIAGEVYYQFHIEIGKRADAAFSGSLSKVENSSNNSILFTHLYNSHGYRQIRSVVEKLSASNSPAFIEGNAGTGKDRLAEIIHSQSQYKDKPMYKINCATLSARELKSLVNDPDSPFYFDYSVFYFKGCSNMDQLLAEQLLTFIHSRELTRNNLLMFSWDSNMTNTENRLIHDDLVNKPGCMHIVLPDLSYLSDQIPKLVNIMINEMNITSGVQISGMEPEAVALLQGFRWSHNLDQFKRILTSAFHHSEPPYIKAPTVSEILQKEAVAYSAPVSEDLLNQGLSLKEIEYSIVMNTLEKENFNQSSTARKLKISRTTLWRIINR